VSAAVRSECKLVSTIDRALVLTAGLGTRLRPLTDVRAKPAIPVAGEAMIRRIIRWLVSRGVTDLVLNLHHLPETLTAVVGDGSDLEARVRYSWEQPRVLGSAGGPRLALPLIAADTFFVINGDTLTDVDLDAIARAHAHSGALVTLALVPNEEFERYGGVMLDADARVTGFVHRGPSAKGSYHFIGVQVAHVSVFAPLTPGEPAHSIGGLYDAVMAANPDSVRGVVCHAEFFDVGTVQDYRRTSDAFAQREGRTGSTVGRRCRIHPSARIVDSILWDDVEVGADAVIEECIVTDGAMIPAGTKHRRCIISQADAGPTLLPFSMD
jgi:mannose-1-phosphate guanylyltransferase